MSAVKVSPSTHTLLSEIAEIRSIEMPHLRHTLTSVVADLAIKEHKKEIKKKERHIHEK